MAYGRHERAVRGSRRSLVRTRRAVVERLEDRCLLSLGDEYGTYVGVTQLADDFNNGSLTLSSGVPAGGITNLWQTQTTNAGCSATEAGGHWTLTAAGSGVGNPQVTVASSLRGEFDIFRTKEEPISFVGTRLSFGGTASADDCVFQFALTSEARKMAWAANDAFGFEVTAGGDVRIFAKTDLANGWNELFFQADALPVAPTGFCLTLGNDYFPAGSTTEVGVYTLEFYWNGGERSFSGAHGLSEASWEANSGANKAAATVAVKRNGSGSTTASVEMDALYAVKNLVIGRYETAGRGRLDSVNRFLPPYVLANGFEADAKVQVGYLPVTLYGATPNDGVDDTAQIQRAIDDARDHSLACFFPSGVYDLSAPLEIVQQSYFGKSNNKWKGGTNNPNVLVGSTVGERPVLRLRDNTFTTVETHLIDFHTEMADDEWPYPASTPPAGTDKPNINFQQLFKGINIDLGSGNTKAIGLRMLSAQGTTVEDVKIYGATPPTTTFFAGIHGGSAHQGGWFNVEVVGGQYGLYMTNAPGVPPEVLVVGATLKNQLTAAIYLDGVFFMVVAVGVEIEKASGDAILIGRNTNFDFSTSLNLIDCSVEFTNGGTAVKNLNRRNLYLRNVYAYNATTLVDNGVAGKINGLANQWKRIEEYSFDIPSGILPGGRVSNSVHVIDGVVSSGAVTVLDTVASAPPPDLVARHLWSDDFPSFEDADAINVIVASKTWAGPRVWGDGKHDDRPGLQYAIDHYQKVLLPKGLYTIAGTLILGEHTRFIGVPRPFTVIAADIDAWNPLVETPLITTVDSAEADTILAHITFAVLNQQVIVGRTTICHYPLLWRAGRDSIQRDLYSWPVDPVAATTYAVDWDVEGVFQYTGNGGGRAYASHYCQGARVSVNYADLGMPPEYRTLRISDTHEPLTIYSFNPEEVLHYLDNPLARAEYRSEISGAQNVQIFGTKIEGGPVAAVHFENCDNVSWVGHANNSMSDLATAFNTMELVDCSNTTVAGIFRSYKIAGASVMIFHEDYYGAVTNVHYDYNVSLAKRGSFQSLHDQISGVVYLQDSGDVAGGGLDVQLRVNGVQAGVGETLSGGRYAIRPTVRIRPGDLVTVSVVDALLGGATELTTDGSVLWHLDVVAGSAPRVTDVLVTSSDWSESVLAHLDAAGMGAPEIAARLGYRVPDGVGQYMAVPWNNVNTIRVVFDSNVSVRLEDLVLTGVNTEHYTISGFAYDSSSNTATWTLASPLGNDKLRLSLSDGILDSITGLRLDGEWIDTVTVGASGDGTPGGDFVFRLNVLPGDLSGDGDVDLGDFGIFAANYGRSSGVTAFKGDLTGNGVVDQGDFGIFAFRYGSALPASEPIVPGPMVSLESGGGSITIGAFAADAVVELPAPKPSISNSSSVTATATDAPTAWLDESSRLAGDTGLNDTDLFLPWAAKNSARPDRHLGTKAAMPNVSPVIDAKTKEMPRQIWRESQATKLHSYALKGVCDELTSSWHRHRQSHSQVDDEFELTFDEASEALIRSIRGRQA